MTAQPFDRPEPKRLALNAAPIAAIALAGLAARTPLALAYPRVSLALFLWVASDTALLSLMARSPGHRPAMRAVLGALAAAGLAVALGSPDALRRALLAMPPVGGALALVVGAHLAWGLARAGRVARTSGPAARERWVAAASEVLPPALARLAAAEVTLVHMALFRWGGPPDAPPDSRVFGYHRHLAPICATLLTLQVIEIGVYHLIVAHWSRRAALAMFVISDVGLIYLVGLIKSFRFRPVLVMETGVLVRAGFLIERLVPFDAIARIDTRLSGEDIRRAGTFNAALLAWPNVALRLVRPMPRRALLRRKAPFDTIAFRLDEPEPFLRLLEERLPRPTS